MRVSKCGALFVSVECGVTAVILQMCFASAECGIVALIFTPPVKERKNGADTSSSRRREYAAGSLLCVNEQGARSGNAEMRSISVVFKVKFCLLQNTAYTTLRA